MDILELDISKYDKSQNEFHCAVEYEIWKRLGLEKDVYHCNEGHAAFLNVQRLIDLMQDKQLSFNEAKEIVRVSCLFTTHTPVPAGHDTFEEPLFERYMFDFATRL